MSTTYYPKSPGTLPENLTKLPSSYQLRASLAVLAIILFFVLYVALIICLGFLVYYAIIYDMEYINKITILMKISAIAGAVMLFVFTLKFMFKLKNPKPTNRIRLQKEQHPELWNFVETICKETGAPKPKNIYVDPDVNAYVSYSNMWLSLFLPVKKELTIGMGLTNSLNLTEFKAVISHEFGHFAQRSMKIGSYINSANTIIHDMIYSRDKWDELLDQWRASDIRLSVAAWIITPIIWLIRQVLALFYQLLNVMYSSLSREMEFNADKVAVSTSGSEAIISALWKLNNGHEKWNETINHAYLATQKKMFSKNLYTHNTIAIEKQSKLQQALLHALPENPLGGKLYFSEPENSKVGMYASHPPNDKREANAKSPFVDAEKDDRSPWILFGNHEALQEKMTALIHEKYLQKTPDEFCTVDVFENFIAQETQGQTLQEEYKNTFENRFITIDIRAIKKEASEIDMPKKDMLEHLKQQLEELMKPVYEVEGLMTQVHDISTGKLKQGSFKFQGVEYKKKNLQNALNRLFQVREDLYNTSFKAWDTSFLAFHLTLAKKAGKDADLLDLYTQHNGITEVYKSLSGAKSKILEKLSYLQSREQVSNDELNYFASDIHAIIKMLDEVLQKLDTLHFVPLPNIDDVSELKEAIVENGKFKPQFGSKFSNEGFERTMNLFDASLSHCQRLEQKSIGVILSKHKEVQGFLD